MGAYLGPSVISAGSDNLDSSAALVRDPRLNHRGYKSSRRLASDDFNYFLLRCVHTHVFETLPELDGKLIRRFAESAGLGEGGPFAHNRPLTDAFGRFTQFWTGRRV